VQGRETKGRWDADMAAEEYKVIQVQALCRIALGCAKVVAAKGSADDAYGYERETYRKRKLRAMQITNSINDHFYFETALHSIIDLCMAAGEVEDARRMLERMSIGEIRDAIRKAHPAL
jgi:pentatricopeptide repeat protein